MIQLVASACGKKYRGKWVLRNLSFTLEAGNKYAITGKNGSGKSTLIKMLAGYVQPGEGRIHWKHNQNSIAPETLFQHLFVVAPYIEPIEEFTFPELIQFQCKFKPHGISLTTSEIIYIAELQESIDKPLKFYSSGMKQRAVLTLAMLSKSMLLLLDEPCANLDKEARLWYADLLAQFAKHKTVVIASNHNKEEYPEVDGVISL